MFLFQNVSYNQANIPSHGSTIYKCWYWLHLKMYFLASKEKNETYFTSGLRNSYNVTLWCVLRGTRSGKMVWSYTR